ncbi:hypothetical protein PN502_04965 [Microcystis aeruginosa CS-338/01]|uniref:hypothetical protein n=1 Tax=Microcystis aeruginosa TaxID=1126 RepID=UPI0023301A97|nr:hypothetical protein [Microcystis aeruginosa]MDB9506455.1 hypothetical protein [Microcystis aeruginosa CS-338/01]
MGTSPHTPEKWQLSGSIFPASESKAVSRCYSVNDLFNLEEVNRPLFAYVEVSSHDQKLVNNIKVLTPVFADNLAELIRGCLEDLLIKVFYQKGEFKLI